ncbi:MAG TPA: hypothetical protein VJ948_12540 [Acidimicrobiia bacterium]|nr:hypothetical protein [Acidimicrobiia bacterium]
MEVNIRTGWDKFVSGAETSHRIWDFWRYPVPGERMMIAGDTRRSIWKFKELLSAGVSSISGAATVEHEP